MLKPKSSHLVERVAEKLLRDGALEGSAAQLLEPDPTVTTAPPGAPPGPDLAPSPAALKPEPVARANRSSLFAPPPADGTVAPAGRRTDDFSVSNVVEARSRLASFADTAERPAAPSVVTADRAPPDTLSNPDLLQGRAAIDAVALERGGMVDWSRTRSRISEEFRLVQRQILRTAFGPGSDPGFSNLLMVTSARPGEGKSFTSVNLAGSIARQGDHHVLLVDADSKRDSFCYSLGLAESRGLLDLVANPKLDPSPLIVRTPIERLSILPVGRERERSAELFSTKEMTRLIQSLGRRYADRLLILDAPPCLSTSDPAVLAPVVGQILFVVEADRTQRDEVEASLDLIQACPTITMVLNKQQISSRYTFGAYSSYYSS
jgi:receptor protein-tyrosine kinase